MSSSTTTTTLSKKRKAASDEEDDHPRKLPAIAEDESATQPSRPSRTAPNMNGTRGGAAGSRVTRKLPAPGARRFQRATSAPPKSEAATTRPARPTRSTTANGRATTTTTVTRTAARTTATRATTTASTRAGASRLPPSEQRLLALQEQLTSIESARAADAARLAADMDLERAKLAELQQNHLTLSQELANAKTHELTQRRELNVASEELEEMRRKWRNEVEELETEIRRKERELRDLREEVRMTGEDLEREREVVRGLKDTVSTQSTAQLTLTTQIAALKAQLGALQAALDDSTGSNVDLRSELEVARERVKVLEEERVEAERLRRKLHNMVLELKGNIRVFCRVRPILPSDYPTLSPSASPIDPATLSADITFPDTLDHRSIVLRSTSESAMGLERKDEWNFTFDRVFGPGTGQGEMFEEIAGLAQSCLDGYNVCVFAYGQTGSGKSFTMEGGQTPETAGMIPRAVEQIFRLAEELKTKGWEYKMEGQFLEIYNETINDLLGTHDFDKKSHTIHHDKHTGLTSVSDTVTQSLNSPSQVRSLLALAASRRTVAATLMNERSSRSHSVFMLRVSGANKGSGERCEGSLNLVDLAGSERLEKSGAGEVKERLRETQSINRSLSALGDVIAALGEKGEGKGDKHVPYRNSKLTYLLQNSLSGNSKTLMILNLSPLANHLNESLCSLRFATKVNNTTIGTAKKQVKTQ